MYKEICFGFFSNKCVTSFGITALVDSDAGPSLSFFAVLFSSHAIIKFGRKEICLKVSANWRQMVEFQGQNFKTTMEQTVQIEAATDILWGVLSFSCGPKWKKKKKKKGKVGTSTTRLASAQKHPHRAHMLSGTKCRCVPYKPCHAWLLTICAASPSVIEEVGEEDKVRQEIIITSLHHI